MIGDLYRERLTGAFAADCGIAIARAAIAREIADGRKHCIYLVNELVELQAKTSLQKRVELSKLDLLWGSQRFTYGTLERYLAPATITYNAHQQAGIKSFKYDKLTA